MMNKSFNLLAIILAVFLIGFLLEETIDSSKLSKYESLEETVEIISELFSVFVALSIFAITWHAYNNSRDNHSLFLGSAFLITGLLTLFHLLSYTFMPDFITPNSPHKASIFFLESRFILAFLLLASVYVQKDSFPKLINRKVMFFFTAAILSVSLASVWIYHDFLFGRFNLDTYSTETVFILVLITIIILVTGFLYYKKAKETFQTNLNYMANGSIIILVSNLVYNSYEFSAHFLIITGFFYFYLGLYKTSVELPYERLAISEEKLRVAAEEKYRRIVETAHEGIWMLDNSAKTSYANSWMAQMLGYTEEEMLGRHLFDFMDADARIEVEKYLGRLKEGFKDTLDFRFSRKDGTDMWAIVSTNPIFDEKGQYVGALGMMTDISQRKQVELEREQFFRFFQITSDLMVIADPNGWFKKVNPACLQTLGYSETELLEKPFIDFIHPEDRQSTIDEIAGQIQLGFTLNFENRYLCKDGTMRWLSWRANYNKDEGITYATARDITESRDAEEALRESEERFRKVFEEGPIGMVLTNHDLNFFSVNPAFCQMLGYTKEEMSIRTFLDLTHPEQRRTDRENVEKLWQGEIPYYRTEKRYITKNGEICWGSLSASLIQGRDGKPLYALAMVENITERKQAEEKIRISLEEKEVLLREIHHRVKNNMQVISSLLMLQSQNIEDKKYKDMFIESQTRIYSMALIHEKLYRSESIAQINFKEYIDGIVSNIFESYCIKSNVKFDINVENIPINIDYAVPCGLIINEIVTNSLKYAFPDGRQGKIHISLKSIDNNMIQLSISDDGIGIAKDLDIRNTKSLGLHLVTALAEGQLHGKIILNRESGTEFQINFRHAK